MSADMASITTYAATGSVQGQSDVVRVTSLTQAAYDKLAAPDEKTLYLIVEG